MMMKITTAMMPTTTSLLRHAALTYARRYELFTFTVVGIFGRAPAPSTAAMEGGATTSQVNTRKCRVEHCRLPAINLT